MSQTPHHRDPAPSSPSPPRPSISFAIVAWLIFAVAFLRGVRMPNLWTATHMTFDYSHGFIRRGLFGQLLHLVAGDASISYRVLALISVVLFVLVATAMFLTIRRMLRSDPDDVGTKAIILVFAASPGVFFFVHLIGYFDYIGLLVILLLVLWMHRTRGRWAVFYVGAAAFAVLALVHEALPIMFAPVLLLAMSCHVLAQLRNGSVSRVRRVALWAHALGATALALAAATVVNVIGTRSPAVIQDLSASLSRVVPFPLRYDAFQTLHQTTRQNLQSVLFGYWTAAPAQRYFWFGIVATLPGLAILMRYGVRYISRLALSRVTRWFLTAVFVSASVLPLSLNLVGWDSARWNAICTMTCFCGVAVLKLSFAPSAAVEGRSLRVDGRSDLTLAAVAIVLGLATGHYTNFMFDGRVPQGYPFEQPLDQAVDLVKHGFQSIPGQ